MFLSKRNGYWYVFYDGDNGKKTCISTRTKIKRDAVKFLSEFQSRLQERRLKKVLPISLSEFRFHYLKYSEAVHSPKTTKGYRTTFNYLLNYFGDIQLSEIKNKKLVEYFHFRIKNTSVYAARKDLINISSCFNKAIVDNYLNENPCKGIKRFRIPEKQPLFFSECEFERLLNVIDDNEFKDIAIFAINTGLRQGEILSLEWEQVNFRDKILVLNNQNHLTKSKKIRTIPLNIKSMQILNDREQKQESNLVFGIPLTKTNQNNISKKFKYYVIKAGINPHLKFHSLRHSFASWLVQRGVSIYEVSKLLGHSDIKVTEIYSHLRAEDLRNSVNLLNN